jgi:hypothetical protein
MVKPYKFPSALLVGIGVIEVRSHHMAGAGPLKPLGGRSANVVQSDELLTAFLELEDNAVVTAIEV